MLGRMGICCLLLGLGGWSARGAEPAGVVAEAPAGEQIGALIERFGDEDFARRQQAEDELRKLLHRFPAGAPNPVEQACLATYQTTSDPEVRERVRNVLADYAVNLWSPSGHLGITTTADQTTDKDGKTVSRLKITKVLPGSPAAAAGLKVDTLIVGVDQSMFGGGNAKNLLDSVLTTRPCGAPITLHLLVNGQPSTLTVILGYRPRPAHRNMEGNEIPPNRELCLYEYFRAKKVPTGKKPPGNPPRLRIQVQ